MNALEAVDFSGADFEERAHRLRDFAKASSEWFWETDADLRFIWFSEEMDQRMGIPARDMIGKKRGDLGADRDPDADWQSHFADLQARRPFRDFCYRVRTADGAEVHLSVSGVPVFDDTGAFRGYRGTGCNITAEVEDRRRRREAEERLRIAFSTSTSAIAISRLADGLLLDVNEAMERYIGCSRRELIGRSSVEMGFWASALERDAWRQSLIATGSMRDRPHSLVRKDGQCRFGLLSARMFLVDGVPHAFVSIDDITETHKAKLELRKLSHAVEQSSTAIHITNTNGVIEYINKSFSQLTGYSSEECIGNTPALLKSNLIPIDFYKEMWKTISEGKDFLGELYNKKKNGDLYWANIRISPVRDADGALTHYIGIQVDMTARKNAEDELRASEERYRSIVESSLLGVCIEQDGRPVFANQTFTDIFGYTHSQDITGLDQWDALWPVEDRRRIAEVIGADASSTNGGVFGVSGTLQCDADGEDGEIGVADDGEGGSRCIEVRGRRFDGSDVFVLAQFKRIPWKGAHATQASVVDITLRKRIEAKLQFQANYDALTGLPNRSLALDRLERAIRGARRRGGKIGVLFIDFDHFKQINDTLGHAIGDDFLFRAAERIKSVTREEDTAARFGGDEFAVILPHIQTSADALVVAKRIVAAMAQPFILRGKAVLAGASIGASIYPEHGDDAETLIKHADAAMYVAKNEGRGTVRLFCDDPSGRGKRAKPLESDLRRAIERDELSIYYRPIVDLTSRAIVAGEAMGRWAHPQFGEVGHGKFLRIAEESGLMTTIGAWMMRRSCADARQWMDRGHTDVNVSVPVSCHQFRDASLLDSVRRELAASGLDATSLELELAERLLIDATNEIVAIVRQLKSFGVRFTVSGFGIGGASINALSRLPLDAVKIDPSFIGAMLDDQGHAKVIDALIAVAQRLGLRVIAEGVETVAQLSLLKSFGCATAHGQYFTPPLPSGEFIALLDSWALFRPPALPLEFASGVA
ncbi:MAG: EAL domain-containing protein [Rhodospirillales bacterium]|nr:EAL domain-containing protein [Rhodospirillales bacterium]